MFDDAPLAGGLTAYGLRDFPGEVVGSGSAAVGDLDGVAETTSVHRRHSGTNGESAVVASSIAGDRETMRYFVLSNMALILRDGGDTELRGKDPPAVLFSKIDDGVYAWEQRPLLVATELVPFEVLEIGRRWAAVGESAATHVGLYASVFRLSESI
ncbi:MAG: hypothetical protein ABR540_18640 [Acidimicrobiales bacterium]